MGEKGKEEWKKRVERGRKRRGGRERRRETERDLEGRNPKKYLKSYCPKVSKAAFEAGLLSSEATVISQSLQCQALVERRSYFCFTWLLLGFWGSKRIL